MGARLEGGHGETVLSHFVFLLKTSMKGKGGGNEGEKL